MTSKATLMTWMINIKRLNTDAIIWVKALTPEHFNDGKLLFREYVNALPFVLNFQDIEYELANIATMYSPPKGALLLAYVNNTAIACTGVRKLDSETAELKRMFVQSKYRGQKIGRQLMQLALQVAKELGYQFIKLDSVREMEAALKLYRAYGFKETGAYCYNPLPTAVYMEKQL